MLMDGSEPSAGTGSSNGSQQPHHALPHPVAGRFSGYQVENSIGDFNKLLLARMDAGVAYLKLTEPPELLD